MRHILALLALLLLVPGCTTEQTPLSQLERIQATGVLRVITRNSPASYFHGPEGPLGLEYELAQRFADHLDVNLELILAVRPADILLMVSNGRVDLAAAGLAVTPTRARQLRFGPAYYEATPQLVYRRGNRRPQTLLDLDEQLPLAVVAGSSHEEWLQELRTGQYPQLHWITYPNRTQQDLLAMVAREETGYAIVNSNEIGHARRYYPEIAVAFDLGEPLDVAWMFRHQEDDSLYQAATDFFRQLADNGELARLRERYFGHIQSYDYVDAMSFLRLVAQRLPELKPHFMVAAAEHGLDWRLLAALGYQESHWDPEARSPTGVRGLMMLTRDTAAEVGVENRVDAEQSIHGGARYLREMLDRIPERIAQPDRKWFALAAYNIGLGHLEDARRLTQAQGDDPDRWTDVRRHLPLLSDPEWHEQTRYGYARGGEPVAFVQNIRRYYDVLVWIDQHTLPDHLRLQPHVPFIASPVL